MGTDSKIEWTDHTLNFWKGCTKVSAGCDHCYMYRDAKRYGWDPTKVTRCGELLWQQPQKRDRQGDLRWRPGERVFVCSWSDFFHKDADKWRAEAWDVVRSRPDLIWIFTTKRIERVLRHLPHDFVSYRNIIIMPTTENQEMANKRIPPALKLKSAFPWIKVMASIEPMLGPVDLENVTMELPSGNACVRGTVLGSNGRHFTPGGAQGIGIDGVIVGGESGPGARPMHPDWPRGVRDQCVAAGVPFFFKQWGAWIAPGLSGPMMGGIPSPSCKLKVHEFPGDGYFCKRVYRVGKKKARRLLDGRVWDEMPDSAGKAK